MSLDKREKNIYRMFQEKMSRYIGSNTHLCMRTGSDLSEGKVAAMDLVVAVHVPKHKHQPIPEPWLLNHCSMSDRIKNRIKIQSNFKLKF